MRTFAEGEEMYGIKEIGLPHAIMSKETIHLGRKVDIRRLDVFEIYDRKVVEYHGLEST